MIVFQSKRVVVVRGSDLLCELQLVAVVDVGLSVQDGTVDLCLVAVQLDAELVDEVQVKYRIGLDTRQVVGEAERQLDGLVDHPEDVLEQLEADVVGSDYYDELQERPQPRQPPPDVLVDFVDVDVHQVHILPGGYFDASYGPWLDLVVVFNKEPSV